MTTLIVLVDRSTYYSFSWLLESRQHYPGKNNWCHASNYNLLGAPVRFSTFLQYLALMRIYSHQILFISPALLPAAKASRYPPFNPIILGYHYF